jgi:hypothetical protein
MTHFLKRLAGFLLLQAAIAAGMAIPWWLQPPTGSYLDAVIDKHARLAQAAPPRVLLAGGSNTAFGFDSPLLEGLVDRPVVNLGLHAGLGPDYICDELRDALRPGDVAILSFEYELWLGWPPTRLAAYARRKLGLSPVPRDWPAIQRELDGAHLQAGDALRSGFESLVAEPGPSVYLRSAFNAHGDMVKHATIERPPITTHGVAVPVERGGGLAGSLRAVARLQAAADRIGARLFIAFPPYPESLAQRDRLTIARIHRMLRKQRGLRLLDTPADAEAPVGDFFDTAYHLRASAAQARTRRLAQALRRAEAGD